jgi:hypothetical protein
MDASVPDNFYIGLPVFSDFTQVTDVARFKPLPGDWVDGVAGAVDQGDQREPLQGREHGGRRGACCIGRKLAWPRWGICILGGRGVPIPELRSTSRDDGAWPEIVLRFLGGRRTSKGGKKQCAPTR